MIRTLVLALTLVFPLGSPFGASEALADTTLHTALGHYQEVRLAMVEDHTAPEAAKAFAGEISTLVESFDAESAAVDPANAEEAKKLLAEIHAGAEALAAAGDDLAAARDALYQATKPLVRYRELMTGEKPAVAYCPMAKKSWLQLENEPIGNPYHGQDMPRCGSIVSE